MVRRGGTSTIVSRGGGGTVSKQNPSVPFLSSPRASPQLGSPSWSLYILTWVLCWCGILSGNFVRAAKTKTSSTPVLRTELIRLCDGKPPITTKTQQKQMNWLVQASGEASLLLKSSSQHLAACWIMHTDQLSKSRGGHRQQFLQRYALAVLHYSGTKSNTTAWDWPMAADDPKAIGRHGDWLHTKKHECQWYGVVCSAAGVWWGYIPSVLGLLPSKHVTALHLGFLKIDGLLPRELYLLSYLKDLDLHGNDLQGVLPHKMVDALHNLESLELHMNGFFGILPREMVGLSSLKVLRLFGNYFAGQLPTHLSQLTDLEVLDLYANFISGTIPTELGQLKKLRVLDLHDNNLVGRVPQQICDLKLDELVVDCLGPRPEVECTCCTACCRGLPEAKCVQLSTGKQII